MICDVTECMTVSHSEPGRFTFTSQGEEQVCGLYLVGRYLRQCCRLFTTFSGQNSQKFRSLSKKIRPCCKNSIFNNILSNKTKFWSYTSTEICKYFQLSFQYFHLEKIKETKLFKNSAPFRPFLGKFGRTFVLPLIFLFGPFEFCGRGQLGTLTSE